MARASETPRRGILRILGICGVHEIPGSTAMPESQEMCETCASSARRTILAETGCHQETFPDPNVVLTARVVILAGTPSGTGPRGPSL